MTPKQTSLKKPLKLGGFTLNLQPASAWTALLGLMIFTILMILAGGGKILNFAFPALAFATGIFLYLRYPVLYLGFSWWMWFLTPLVRRLADYRSSFTDPSPILLAPYLVGLVTFITLWKFPPKIRDREDLPFLLVFMGIFYGFGIGVILNSPFTAFKGLLNWLCPVLFGFHLFRKWQNYPNYRQNIQRTFVWGVLIMGSYGIIQYLILPEWDRLWLTNVRESLSAISFGDPEPRKFRVWSTMHDMGTFGSSIAIGLLLLFNQKGNLPISSSIAGYLSLLVTSSRTAWGAWAIGFLALASSLKAKYQMRLFNIVLVIALCVVPLTMLESFSDTINTRFQTFTNLGDDSSAQGRQGIYEHAFNRLITNFVGDGLGSDSPAYESPLLYPFIELGWLGGTFYMSGLLSFFVKLWQSAKISSDLFVATTRAIAIATFTQILFSPVMTKPFGIFVWGFWGINIAANKYHRHQRAGELK